MGWCTFPCRPARKASNRLVFTVCAGLSSSQVPPVPPNDPHWFSVLTAVLFITVIRAVVVIVAPPDGWYTPLVVALKLSILTLIRRWRDKTGGGRPDGSATNEYSGAE